MVFAALLTVSSLMHDMYVDDLLKSLDTIKDVRTLYSENIQLFADSAFQLTKWSTNAPEVYADIPKRSPKMMLLQDHNSPTTQGAMGLQWNSLTDRLTLDEKTRNLSFLRDVAC